MLIGSLVELHAWLHSYMCFSFLEKLFLSNLDTSSTPRYLSSFSTSSYRNLNSFLTARWIDRQTFWTLDSFLMASGSIELVYYLFCWLFLDRSSTVASIDVFYARLLTPLDTSIYRDLLNYYLFVQRNPVVILLDVSLNLSILSPPKTLPFTPNFTLKCFSSFLKFFSSLGEFLISYLHAFHVLKPMFWGFWKLLGFFQNWWVFVEILGWVFA